MSEPYDVAVVGAGFAGTLVGVQLALRGYRVALLEQTNAAHQHTRSGNLCAGEWWRLTGQSTPPPFLKPLTCRTRLFFLPDGVLKKEEEPGAWYAFRRADLDGYLRQRALSAGVAVVDRFAVERIVCGPESVAFAQGAESSVGAKALVIATGAEEQLLLRSGLLQNATSRNVRLVCQEHVVFDLPCRAVPQGGAVLLTFQSLMSVPKVQGYLLAFPKEAFLVVLGTVSPSLLSDWEFKPRAVFSHLRSHPELARWLSGGTVAQWCSRTVGTDPPLKRRIYGNRFLCVGDAALPVGGAFCPGSGFRWAALTAREAAACLSKSLPNPTRLRLRWYAERLAPVARRAASRRLGEHLAERLVPPLGRLFVRMSDRLRG